MRLRFRYFYALGCAILAVAALAPLAGCTQGQVQSTGSAAATVAATVADSAGIAKPTPCVSTTIDEKVLIISARAVDAAATASIKLVEAHVIEPGSPRAIALATALDKARDAVNIAAAARDACNATSYSAALANIQDAMNGVLSALKPE